MKQLSTQSVVRIPKWSAFILWTLLIAPVVGAQQTPADHSVHHPATAPADAPLADQVADLRAKVAKLEALLQQKQMAGMGGTNMPMNNQMEGMTSGSSSGGSMSGMGMMQGMMKDEMGSMGSMSGQGMSGSSGMSNMSGMNDGMMSMMSMMDNDMMGMMGMSPANVASGMAMPNALPGFPGASHLYHIGSTGFFLDHPNHITLSVEQQTALNAAKEKALLDKASKQREIDAAEQELWMLTASDQPDAAKIEAKIRQIEQVRGDQRLAFIRAVGEAAMHLTEAQRQSLLGRQPPQNQNSMPGMSTPPASGGGMGDM